MAISLNWRQNHNAIEIILAPIQNTDVDHFKKNKSDLHEILRSVIPSSKFTLKQHRALGNIKTPPFIRIHNLKISLA